jgi:hypothetical protein
MPGATTTSQGVAIWIAEIAGVTAVLGLVRGLQQQGAAGDCEIQHGIDFFGELQFQASVAPRKVFGRGWSGSVASAAS